MLPRTQALSRRLAALHPSVVSTTHRAYSSKRAPTLADIKPESPQSFNEAQLEFRNRLKEEAETAKRRELEEASTSSARAVGDSSSSSALSSSPTSSTSSSSPSSNSRASVFGATLGSLTSAFADEARAREDAVAGKKAGPLTTLIYGTPEGREMDREIERSFSQVLARGKYVHSIVTHEVKPDKVDEYVALVGEWYPKVASSPEMHVNLVGSWRTEIGDSDTFGMTSQTVIDVV